jgi:hypothetical protein
MKMPSPAVTEDIALALARTGMRAAAEIVQIFRYLKAF